MKVAVRLIIVALILAVLVSVFLIFGTGLRARYHVWQAERALGRNDYNAAIRSYESALELTPQDISLRLDLAELLTERELHTRAEQVLLDGLERQANNSRLLAAYAVLLAEQDRMTEAVALLDGQIGMQLVPRPSVPVPSIAAGQFNEELVINFTLTDGTRIFYSIDGSFPSLFGYEYSDGISLQSGTTTVQAIAVNENGVPSMLFEGIYIIADVIAPVTFTDPAIEALARLALARASGTIYTEDVWQIETLSNIDTAHIPQSLNDLQHFRNLHTLTLVGSNETVNITAITSLTQLQSLTLDNMRIETGDLELIATLPQLQSLSLSNNRIIALGALEALTNVESLTLSRNSISNIAPLEALTKLTHLDISENSVRDISPLAAMTGLEVLIAHNNQAADLEPLQALVYLREIDLTFNRISELSALSNLIRLETLSVRNNTISSVVPLQNLPALRDLDVGNNNLTTLLPLLNNPALRSVDAFGNNLTDAANAFSGARFTLRR